MLTVCKDPKRVCPNKFCICCNICFYHSKNGSCLGVIGAGCKDCDVKVCEFRKADK